MDLLYCYRQYNQIKLPITNKNRQCDSEYGCEELYDDDEVTYSSL